MDTELKVGDRVTKGPTWKWNKQGGDDPKGEVVSVGSTNSEKGYAWFNVKWDNGDGNEYRFGGDIRDIIPLRETTPSDLVEKPVHYARFVIEPITFIMKNKLEFWRGNPIKYIARAGHKPYPGQTAEQSEVTDIKKAIRMLEMRLNDIEGKDVL